MISFLMRYRPNYGFVATLLLTVAIIITLLWWFSTITTYFVIAIIIASIGSPITEYLSRRNILGIPLPRTIAVILAFATILSFLAAFVTLFVPLISDQVRVLKEIDLDVVKASLGTQIKPLEQWIIDLDIADVQEGFILKGILELPEMIFNNIQVGDILTQALNITGSLLAGTIAVVFISFFLLFEKGKFVIKVFDFIPNKYFELFVTVYYQIQHLLSNYLLGLILQMVMIFSLAGLGLTILGVKYALTIALFAAVANLIPYVGPILGSTFGVITSIITYAGEMDFNLILVVILKIFIVFGAVQLMDNVLFQPIIFSRSVKAHPLEIFVIVFVGATIGGIIGMIAAIPVYTIVKVSVVQIRKGMSDYKAFNISNY